MSISLPRCWHCNKRFSNMNTPPGMPYWFSEVELESGRSVKVHKNCADAARESIRKLTAVMHTYRPPEDDHEET